MTASLFALHSVRSSSDNATNTRSSCLHENLETINLTKIKHKKKLSETNTQTKKQYEIQKENVVALYLYKNGEIPIASHLN